MQNAHFDPRLIFLERRHINKRSTDATCPWPSCYLMLCFCLGFYTSCSCIKICLLFFSNNTGPHNKMARVQFRLLESVFSFFTKSITTYSVIEFILMPLFATWSALHSLHIPLVTSLVVYNAQLTTVYPKPKIKNVIYI